MSTSEWWSSQEARSAIKEIQSLVPLEDVAVTTILRTAAFDIARGKHPPDKAFEEAFSWAIFVGDIGPTNPFLDTQVDWATSSLKDKALQRRLFAAMESVLSHKQLLGMLIRYRLTMSPFDQKAIEWEPLVNQAMEAIKNNERQ